VGHVVKSVHEEREHGIATPHGASVTRESEAYAGAHVLARSMSSVDMLVWRLHTPTLDVVGRMPEGMDHVPGAKGATVMFMAAAALALGLVPTKMAPATLALAMVRLPAAWQPGATTTLPMPDV
jgi:hypothetical protein